MSTTSTSAAVSSQKVFPSCNLDVPLTSTHLSSPEALSAPQVAVRGAHGGAFDLQPTPKYLHRRRRRWDKSHALGGRTKNFRCILWIHGSPLQTSARRIKVTPDQSPTIVYLPGHRIHCIYVIPDGALNSEHTCIWQVYADGIFLSCSWRLRSKKRAEGSSQSCIKSILKRRADAEVMTREANRGPGRAHRRAIGGRVHSRPEVLQSYCSGVTIRGERV